MSDNVLPSQFLPALHGAKELQVRPALDTFFYSINVSATIPQSAPALCAKHGHGQERSRSCRRSGTSNGSDLRASPARLPASRTAWNFTARPYLPSACL